MHFSRYILHVGYKHRLHSTSQVNLESMAFITFDVLSKMKDEQYRNFHVTVPYCYDFTVVPVTQNIIKLRRFPIHVCINSLFVFSETRKLDWRVFLVPTPNRSSRTEVLGRPTFYNLAKEQIHRSKLCTWKLLRFRVPASI